MPLPPTSNLLSYLGLVQWGDIGEMTTYRRPDGRLVVFAKTYPDKPPSTQQLADRAAFSAAAVTWRTLTAPQRLAWTTAAARLSLCMTGYNLFIALTLKPDAEALATIERQASLTLALVP